MLIRHSRVEIEMSDGNINRLTALLLIATCFCAASSDPQWLRLALVLMSFALCLNTVCPRRTVVRTF